jgi:hypothetical protein
MRALDMAPPAETTKVPTYARRREASCMRINQSLTLRWAALTSTADDATDGYAG